MPRALSFRDPAGFCISLDARFLRAVAENNVADVEAFLASRFGKSLLESGRLIPTRLLAKTEVADCLVDPAFQQCLNGRRIGAVFEHERIEFPSFPYEWPPSMLYAAGRLTLDLAQEALEADYTLKDATPYNVLFRGPKPVFVDLLSFEPRQRGECIWRPYAQFVRTFLLPLLVNKHLGRSLADVFLTHRDGLEPEEVYRSCRGIRKLIPPFLTHVSLPTWLSGKARTYNQRSLANDEKARFIVQTLLKRLDHALEGMRPRIGKSVWSTYADHNSYDAAASDAKQAFVRSALDMFRPINVLDVGANTGQFSILAAQSGAKVVAIDSDAVCAGMLWERAKSEGLEIQSLVMDFARPSAGIGWRNEECPSFLDRAKGKFDGVLMLAVLHHLLVTERIPLNAILCLLAELTCKFAIIEFVAPEDKMFQVLLRGREALHAGLTRQVFEAECRRHFEIVQSFELPGTHRSVYLLRVCR